VLVFKDATGKTTVKMADFGYSTLATGDVEKVFLPKSRPWNAPEHHFGGFEVPEAKKTDVYSYGMLCFWVLFGTVRIPENTMQFAFDASTGPHTPLEKLKDDDKLRDIANILMESVPLVDLNSEFRIHLKEIFSLTVQLNPEKRISDVGKLVGLFEQERLVSPMIISKQSLRNLEPNLLLLDHLR
jgi:serine/threonine protein kinase